MHPRLVKFVLMHPHLVKFVLMHLRLVKFVVHSSLAEDRRGILEEHTVLLVDDVDTVGNRRNRRTHRR